MSRTEVAGRQRLYSTRLDGTGWMDETFAAGFGVPTGIQGAFDGLDQATFVDAKALVLGHVAMARTVNVEL